MEITISYEFDPKQTDYPYWSRVKCADPLIDQMCCGSSWEEVREKAHKKVELIVAQIQLAAEVIKIPEPEVINV